MKTSFVNPTVRWAAVICVVVVTARANAITKTFTDGNVLSNNVPNSPWFTIGGPRGFVGDAVDKTIDISHVTGTGIEIGGDASMPDLSDGNGLPMGVRFVYDLNFTVQATSGTNPRLSNGGTNGLAVFTGTEGTTNQNRINVGEQLRFFDIAISNVSIIDPLGLIQPGSVSGANALWRALRSTDIGTGQTVTTSSDAAGTQNVTVFGPGQPQVIQDNLTAGVFPPMPSVYVTTSGTGNWRLRANGYQADLGFELAATQPAERRTFKFFDPAFSYDNQPSHSITDRDTFISITPVAPPPSEGQQPTVLDTNNNGVGVFSHSDTDPNGDGNPADALSDTAARRISGSRSEAMHFSFQRDVSLESITLGNFNCDDPANVCLDPVAPTGETMQLSFVSGVNPFTGLTGYSGNYSLTPDGLSLLYTMNEARAEGSPFLIPFGMGAQSEIVVEAGTVLALTSLNEQDNGILLDMITANLLEIPVLEGDYNNDGSVNAADYALWRNGGPLANEVDTPGTVNDADYDAWRARFGNPGGGSGTSSAIPEPCSAAILIIWALLSGAFRSRLTP